VRELRKAGLDPAGMKVRDRTRGSGGPGDYAVELLCGLRVANSDRSILIECRNEPAPIAAALIEALHAKLEAAKAQNAMMFSTSGFDADAARTARALGVPLLAVADGKTAFARSP